MEYQQPIFQVGKRYRVKREFVNGPRTFEAGEVLIFDRNAYSHYDNSFVYVFRSDRDNSKKEWWLHEDEPAEAWKENFVAL